MQNFWIPAFLVLNTLVAFLLGWIANRAWVRSQKSQEGGGIEALSVPEPEVKLSPQGQQCRALLADIWVDLGVYSQALQEFMQALEHDLPGAQLSASGGPLAIVREAGGRFAMMIDENQTHLQEFANRYGGVLQTMVGRITEFRSRAEETDKHFAKLESAPATELKAFVGETTLKLIEDNLKLRSELTTARRCIAEKELSLQVVQRDARIDALTELPNQQAFDEKGLELHAYWERYEQPYAVALLDIDDFGELNATHGFAAGDAMLQAVAQVVRNNKRAVDHVARLEEDRFGVFIPRCALPSAERVADRYRRAIAAGSLIFRDERLAVTVSVGVAEVRPGEQVEQLLQRAESALQRACAAGPCAVSVHDGDEVRSSVLVKPIEETVSV